MAHLVCLMVFPLTFDQFMCCVSRHNNQCKQSVPRFPLYILFSFDLKTAKNPVGYSINSLPVCCSTK